MPKMKIVYIDKASYLPEWGRKKLADLGDFVAYPDTPTPSVAAERLRDADIAIVEWTDITADLLEKPGRLKCIVLVTTGYSFVDIAAARKKHVLVCNTPQYSRYSVAEHAIGMVLSLAKRLSQGDALVRAGHTEYTAHSIGKELYGTQLGVLGMGSIGSWVAHLGMGLGMKVGGHSRSKFSVEGVKQFELNSLLESSDVLVSCVSVNSASKNLLSRERLTKTKADSILVNIAGNSVLDEVAVADLLDAGHFYGVGFEEVSETRLLRSPRTLLSPGTAWYTQASLDRNVEMFVETVRAFAIGQPRFVVN